MRLHRMILAVLTISIGMLVHSCKEKSAALAADREYHDLQFHYPGIGMIYIDRGECNKILKGDSVANKLFTCYRIVVVDSTQPVTGSETVTSEHVSYYQYSMEQDWKALHQGDSLGPAIMHVTRRLQKNRYEGVVVFELPDEQGPDTLFFNDTRGIWGKQQFILTN